MLRCIMICALRVARRLVRRLGLFGFLAHEALRKRSASGSAGNFGIQVGSRRPGRPGSSCGGVLTEYSRRSKWTLKKGVHPGHSRGARRGATHGAAALGRTNGSRCSGCRRTSVPSAVRVAPSTHVALKYLKYCLLPVTYSPE
jgi:hypothetical protein